MGIAREYVVALMFVLFMPMPSVFGSSVNYVIGAFVVVCVIIYLWSKSSYSIDVEVCYFFLAAFVCWWVALVQNIGQVDVLVVFREVYKLFFYFLLFYVSLKYLMEGEYSKKIPVDLVVGLFVVGQMLIVLFQSTTLGAEMIGVIYSTEKLSAGISLYSDRVRYIGSFENPNYLSFFFCLMVAWLCSKNKYKLFHFILFLLSLIGLVLTGSRTGLIVFLVLVFIRFIFFVPLIGMILLYSWGLIFDKLMQVKRFNELLLFETFFYESTYAIRRTLVDMAWGFVDKKPFFGYFESPIPIPDNLYMLIMLRYGMIGMLILIIIVLYSIYRWRDFFVGKVFFYTGVVAFMFSLTGAFLDNPRFYGFFVLSVMMFIYDEKRDVILKKNESKV